ncbi:MAG TPA: IPT/TIG domain-containing protein [Gemmataceae bacterium]|nr:IPT/TIG domain-containing protein [Gemmataceae bacterium]
MRVILSTVAAASPRPLCRTMAVVGLLAASAMATPARADLLGKQLFPSDNAWRQDISNAPVAANSAAIIAKIGTVTRITPYWYRDNPADGTFPLYGIPYNVVHGNSTAKVSVVVDNFPSESDLVPVPIPPNAVLEGDYENGPNPNGAGYGENGNPNQRGDSHLIVFDVDNNVAYELYGVSRPGDSTLFPDNADVEQPHTDGLWHAAQETVWDFNQDSFRTLGEVAADVSGLSILAGLARPDEGLPVAQGGQGVINHALRVTLPPSAINPQYVYPASHMFPSTQAANNVPLGARLRLKQTPVVNDLISAMPPQSQIIARAMQKYGLIVADIGSAMYVSGASAAVDAANNISLVWDTNDIQALNGLEALMAGDFEVVNLTPMLTSLSASSGAAGSMLTITGQNFSGAAGHLSVLFGGTTAGAVNVLSDTQISVTVPSGSGTVNVTVQSGVDEVDTMSPNPNANVNAPIFGYGTSALTAAGQFTYTQSFCGTAPNPLCLVAAQAQLQSNDKHPGKENLELRWTKIAAATTRGSFGDPVGGSAVAALCVFNDAGTPVGELIADRAGQTCGTKPCWKLSGKQGLVYNDKMASAAGVAKIGFVGGDAGKGEASAQGKNNASKGLTSLPTGLSAALTGNTSPTIELVTSDGLCVGAKMNRVVKDAAQLYKAQRK